uniref:Uncharacterized protein n=1 Tax=Anguilla anguilla TaxID=7936 RepID=A0A0E9VD87_ANGAN
MAKRISNGNEIAVLLHLKH